MHAFFDVWDLEITKKPLTTSAGVFLYKFVLLWLARTKLIHVDCGFTENYSPTELQDANETIRICMKITQKSTSKMHSQSLIIHDH